MVSVGEHGDRLTDAMPRVGFGDDAGDDATNAGAASRATRPA